MSTKLSPTQVFCLAYAARADQQFPPFDVFGVPGTRRRVDRAVPNFGKRTWQSLMVRRLMEHGLYEAAIDGTEAAE